MLRAGVSLNDRIGGDSLPKVFRQAAAENQPVGATVLMPGVQNRSGHPNAERRTWSGTGAAGHPSPEFILPNKKRLGKSPRVMGNAAGGKRPGGVGHRNGRKKQKNNQLRPSMIHDWMMPTPRKTSPALMTIMICSPTISSKSSCSWERSARQRIRLRCLRRVVGASTGTGAKKKRSSGWSKNVAAETNPFQRLRFIGWNLSGLIVAVSSFGLTLLVGPTGVGLFLLIMAIVMGSLVGGAVRHAAGASDGWRLGLLADVPIEVAHFN